MSAYLIKKLTKILHKPEDERDMNDIHFLTQNIVKNIPLLYDTFQDQFHKLISKSLRLVRYKLGDVVFRQQEYADSLFMVLSGKVGAVVEQKEESHSAGETDTFYRRGHSKVRAALQQLEQQLGSPLVLQEVFQEGMAIHESEFVKNQERPFGGVSLAESVLVVLTKKDLDQQINSEKNHFHHHQAVIDFLQSLPLFSPAEPSFVKELYFNSQQQDYSQGALVYNVNYPSEFFYVVKHGMFKVFQEFFNQDIESTPTVVVKSKKDRPNLFAKPLNVQIQTKGPGDHFGMDELVASTPRKHQVQCASSSGTLIAVRKVFFLKKVWTHHHFKDALCQQMEKQQKLENQVYFQYNVNQQFAQRELQKQIVKKIAGLTSSNNYSAKFNLPLEHLQSRTNISKTKRDEPKKNDDPRSKSLMRSRRDNSIQQENQEKVQQRVEKQLEYYKTQQQKKQMVHYQSLQGFSSLYPDQGSHQVTKFKKLVAPVQTGGVMFPRVSPDKKRQMEMEMSNRPLYQTYSHNYRRQLSQKNLSHIMDQA